jgi:hypothetical protein
MNVRTEGESYEGLTRLMEVFSGDKDLMNWFRTLQIMGDQGRQSHLSSMIEGMRTSGERPDLITAVESLMSPEVFKSTMQTFQSLGR